MVSAQQTGLKSAELKVQNSRGRITSAEAAKRRVKCRLAEDGDTLTCKRPDGRTFTARHVEPVTPATVDTTTVSEGTTEHGRGPRPETTRSSLRGRSNTFVRPMNLPDESANSDYPNYSDCSDCTTTQFMTTKLTTKPLKHPTLTPDVIYECTVATNCKQIRPSEKDHARCSTSYRKQQRIATKWVCLIVQQLFQNVPRRYIQFFHLFAISNDYVNMLVYIR